MRIRYDSYTKHVFIVAYALGLVASATLTLATTILVQSTADSGQDWARIGRHLIGVFVAFSWLTFPAFFAVALLVALRGLRQSGALDRLYLLRILSAFSLAVCFQALTVLAILGLLAR